MKLLIFLVLPFVLFADTGTLVKVVDGDTLHFKTNNKVVKCRIQHIDTPESSNNDKNQRDLSHCSGATAKDMSSAGESATRAAKRLLTINKEYEYDVNGKDRYGRSIRHYNALLDKAKSGRAGLWSNRQNSMECLDEARK
jgi:endonuclease YncB( thermonuclease family)